MPGRATGALLVLALAACGTSGPPRAPHPPPPDSIGAAAPDAGGVPEPPPARRGVPHYAAIVATAVSALGDAALSRDVVGEVRLWPRIDGTAAPEVVPIRSIATMRVQANPGWILVGAVDEAGTGYLLRYRRDGIRDGVATFAAGDAPVTAVVPLGDASAALIVRADHGVELVDPSGQRRGTLASHGTRVHAIEIRGPRELLAITRVVDGGAVAYRLLGLADVDGRLTRGIDHPLARPPRETMSALAVSPDGEHVAYFVDRDAPPPPPPAPASGAPASRSAGRRLPPPPRPPSPGPARVAVVEVATGRDVTPADLAGLDLANPTQLGFTGDDDLRVFTASASWNVSLRDGAVIAGATARGGATPSTAARWIVSAHDRFLVTLFDDRDLRYLGYAASVPVAAGLSDDGRTVAWATRDGAIVIEPVDGGPEVAGPTLEGGIGLVRFVGDDHVLVVTNRGIAYLLDARTGAQQGALPVAGSPATMTFDPRRRWLAGPHPGGGAWVVAIDPTTTKSPLVHLAVVPDGATMVALLDDDARALVTLDGRRQLRSYAVRELTAGIGPAAIRDRPAIAVPGAVRTVDRRGRVYDLSGRTLGIRTPFEPSSTPAHTSIELTLDPRNLVVTPDGGYAIALSATRVLEAVGLTTPVRWTAPTSTVPPTGWAFSADGRRVVVVAQDGATIYDLATGTPVGAGCGWRFGAHAAPPSGLAMNMSPVCARY